jgi:hypothetical protein
MDKESNKEWKYKRTHSALNFNRPFPLTHVLQDVILNFTHLTGFDAHLL